MVYEQKVNYDWKPPHCLTCGVFGHRDCNIMASKMEMDKDAQDILTAEGGKHPTSGLDVDSCLDEHNLKHLPATSGIGQLQQLPVNLEEEEGWRVVRAKKKGRVGSGPPGLTHTRSRSVGVKPAEMNVSSSHWLNQKSAVGKVSQTANFLKQNHNLNFKSGPSSAPCPISPSEKIGLDGGQPGTETCPLEHISNCPVGPTTLESSAGHTPFPNRLAHLARGIRGRQCSRPGLPKTSSGPAVSAGLFPGQKSSPLFPAKIHDEMGDDTRPASDLLKQNEEVDRVNMDGPNGIGVQNSIVQKEKEYHMMNSESEEEDEELEPQESEHFQQIFPFLFDRGKQISAGEKMEIEDISGGRVNGKERRRAGKGQSMAEPQNC